MSASPPPALPTIQVEDFGGTGSDNLLSPSSEAPDSASTFVASPSFSSAAPTLLDSRRSAEEAEQFLNEKSSGNAITTSAHGYNPEQLLGLIDPKNAYILQAMGGLTGLEKSLVTDANTGLIDSQLTDQEIEARSKVYGSNTLPDKKTNGLFKIMLMTLNDKVLIILIVAAVISLALGLYETFGEGPQYDKEGRKMPKVDWVEGVAILVAVVIVTVVGSVNDWQKERQFAKLNKKKDDREINVLRNGNEMHVNIKDVMVGDVVMVQPGDMLAVDGVVIVSNDIQCDESSVTGESDTMKKLTAHEVMYNIEHCDTIKNEHSLDCMMISGSKVLQGSGRYLVTGVGENSMFGHTLLSLNQGIEVTPLQEKLNRIADGIALFGMWSAILLFVVLFIRFLVEITHGRYSHLQSSLKGNKFMDIFIVSVTIIVVAVPEGLPLAVTLALAFATTRMVKENCLVRVLKSCETMGGATTVCSDKTGTLTQNKMTVVAVTVGKESWRHQEPLLPVFEQDGELLRDAICVNSSVYEEFDDPEVLVGSKTESALIGFARSGLGIGIGKLKDYRASRPIEYVVPFDSTRKYMLTILRLGPDKYRLHIKGAAEILLQHTTYLHNATGGKPIDISEAREFLDSQIETYANDALRPIAVAYKDFTSTANIASSKPDDIDISGLSFLGLFGIMDPLRDGVVEAVAQCRRAGVIVRMVTGDNVRTARAISINAGIIDKNDEESLVLEGQEFRKYTDNELYEIAPRLRVLARSSPQDKRRLVQILQTLGDTVAVTGDGTNDAPALRLADVGFSMGITGTEVAKEASDIVIMDDNFASIVNAMKWGRTVNDAVKKFLQFQLTVNVTAVALTFVSAVANSDNTSVLTAVQLLWVNLIMDTLAALALATDAPTDEVLDRKPDNRKVSLITITMWKMIFGQALFQLAVTFVLHFAGKHLFGYSHKYLDSRTEVELSAMVFNAFVWMQFFNMFVNRRLDNGLNLFVGISKNFFFPLVVLVIGGFQVLIMFVGGAAFSVIRQSGAMWATAIICGLVSIPVGVLLRMIPDSWVQAIYPRKLISFLVVVIANLEMCMVWLFSPVTWLWNKSIYGCKCLYAKARGRPVPPKSKEADIVDDEDAGTVEYVNYNWQPGIQKSLDDLQLIRRIRGGRLRQLKLLPSRNTTELEKNTVSTHNRFLHPRSHHSATSSVSSLTALMAPFVVSGAVGGWSPQNE